MGVALWLTQRMLFAAEPHGVARMAALSALVGVGLVSYGLAAALFGAGDWRALLRMRRRGRQDSGAGAGAEADTVPRP